VADSYSRCKGSEADSTLVESCVALFSNHYGVWGDRGPAPGKHVKLTAKRLSEQYLKPFEFIHSDATAENTVIGHAIGVKFYC
jgi:hypothetical protein